MTQITLDGKTLNLAYNMQTAIAFQRITGKNPLLFEQFTNDIESIMSLSYCMILTNNDTYHTPDFEEFLKLIQDVETMTAIVTAASKELQAFFAPDKTNEPTEASADQEPKND